MSDLLHIDGCTIDLAERVVCRSGVRARLTPMEVAVLRHLSRRRGQVVTRRSLLTDVWGYSATTQTRAVDAALLRLRKKVERDAAAAVVVQTVFGEGVRMPRGTGRSLPTSELIGRGELLTAVAGALRPGAAVALQGEGGVGKTVFARAVLAGATEPGWFVPLDVVRSVEEVQRAVVSALALPAGPLGEQLAALPREFGLREAEDMAGDDIFGVIDALVDHCLVQRCCGGAQSRYRILEPVRTVLRGRVKTKRCPPEDLAPPDRDQPRQRIGSS